MFDVDTFVADCRSALGETEPRLAIRDVLERAMADPAAVRDALPLQPAPGLVPLHRAPDLTIVNVVWSPGMSVPPHDHRMWAAIGVFNAGEDNAFFRRDGATLTSSGGRELRSGDVCLLGDDVIHAVTNPTSQPTGAIHVYGGDFFATPRSEWHGEPLTEEPYDLERVLALFDASAPDSAR